MKSQNKGQIRIIEAFLAVLVIFSSLAISSNLTMTQDTSRSEDLASVGFESLMKLASDGSLGRSISNGNWSALRDTLSIVLPVSVCFNLTVYDDQMQQVNNATISNGGFTSQQIAFVEYLCVSQEPVFQCYIIHLRLAMAT
jgi:hypothetical protein